jgi:large subunit ribosomal protein L25
MSKKQTTIQVETRSQTGKGAVRRLRAQGRVPAVMYGHGTETVALTVPEPAIRAVIHHPGLIQMERSGHETVSAIVKDVQRNCLNGQIVHVDFQQVRADEVITATIRIEATGTPVGAQAGGQLEQVLHELQIRVKAGELFDLLEVDVSGLELNGTLHVRELPFPAGVVPVIDPNATVFQVRLPKIEEEAAPAEGVEGAEAAAAEPEVIAKGKKLEDGAEDEAAPAAGKDAKDAKGAKKKEEKA